MKIRTKAMDFDKVMSLPRCRHHLPSRPSMLLASLIRLIAIPDLLATRFSFTTHGMEKLGKKEPCLILMNHSCFLDMEIAFRVLYPRRIGIITTSDAFVGKDWLMRWLGCIPTQKFVNDITLIRDMEHLLKHKKSSVLMYPEASYSFDGTATPLPRKMGVLLKKLGVPVVMISTKGAFTHQPLYNSLRKRKVKVSAEVTCLATAEEIKSMTVAQLDDMLDKAFTYDHFAWQQENGVIVDTPERADKLNRILFRCPHCDTEGQTEGKGIHLTCHACGKVWELTPEGKMKATEGTTEFDHIPDWYRWQREKVRQELESGSYRLEADVDIAMMVDYKAIYKVGSGKLTHDCDGFRLTGCDGRLEYSQGALANYGLYSDYLWYEIADVICIGNADALYYCFPKGGDVVAKTRMAAEELYKLKKHRRVKNTAQV